MVTVILQKWLAKRLFLPFYHTICVFRDHGPTTCISKRLYIVSIAFIFVIRASALNLGKAKS